MELIFEHLSDCEIVGSLGVWPRSRARSGSLLSFMHGLNTGIKASFSCDEQKARIAWLGLFIWVYLDRWIQIMKESLVRIVVLDD